MSICVVDWVEFTMIAPIMAEYFEKVYYNPNPAKSGFTEIAAAKLGSGLKGVTQIPTIWKDEDNIDIFMFPDIEFMDLANKLKKDGRYTWGSGDSEMLELDRALFLEELKKVGLPVPETEIIETFTKEIEYLKTHKDIWVKINKYRGIKETFHVGKDEDINEMVIADIMRKVRPFADDKDLIFLNQKPIESKVEYGRDRFAVNGMFANKLFMGFEKKGMQYLSKYITMEEQPKEAQEIDVKFSQILQKYKYTGFCSDEVRVSKDNIHYLIDPCMRCGYPSSPSYLHAVTNWNEIIERGVKGEVIDPISKYKYCAEIIIHYNYEGYSPLTYKNTEHASFLPTTYARRKGKDWRVPANQLYSDSLKAGICVGGGQTVEEAIANCTEVFESVEGEGLEKINTLKEFSQEIIEGMSKATGYNF